MRFDQKLHLFRVEDLSNQTYRKFGNPLVRVTNSLTEKFILFFSLSLEIYPFKMKIPCLWHSLAHELRKGKFIISENSFRCRCYLNFQCRASSVGKSDKAQVQTYIRTFEH